MATRHTIAKEELYKTMSGEVEPKLSPLARLREGIHNHPFVTATAIGAVMVGGYSGYRHLDNWLRESGTSRLLQPIDPQPKNVDEFVQIASWNMHGEVADRLDEINTAATEQKLDVLMMQEVKTADAKLLQQKFTNATVYFMLADKKQELTSGGYGNAMVVFGEKPEQLETHSMSGQSTIDALTSTTEGLVKDAVNRNKDLRNSREAMRESRVIGGLVVKGYNGMQVLDIAAITTHIGGQSDVREDQYSQVLKYAEDQVKDDRPAVICADLNIGDFETVRDAFTEKRYYIEKTGPTTPAHKRRIDYCAYRSAGKFASVQTRTIEKHKTDHTMLLLSIKLKRPETN